MALLGPPTMSQSPVVEQEPGVQRKQKLERRCEEVMGKRDKDAKLWEDRARDAKLESRCGEVMWWRFENRERRKKERKKERKGVFDRDGLGFSAGGHKVGFLIFRISFPRLRCNARFIKIYKTTWLDDAQFI